MRWVHLAGSNLMVCFEHAYDGAGNKLMQRVLANRMINYVRADNDMCGYCNPDGTCPSHEN